VLGSLTVTGSHLSVTSDEDYNDRLNEWETEQKRKRVDSALENASLPRRHMRPLTYSGDRWKAIFRRVSARLQTGSIIALIGPRGTGKTQMAIAAIREAAERELSFRYCTAMDIFLDIKDSYRKGGSERDAIKAYTKPTLLVVDEMQERGETPWEDRLLTHILDKRYANMKDTILVSNQTQQVFLQSVGPSVASRISEAGGVAVCDWESFRDKEGGK